MVRCAWVLLLFAGDDISGPVRYAKDGVELDGRKILWKDVKSLTESDPDLDKLRAEYEERAKKTSDHVFLGRWCRERGLEKEARGEFDRAIELETDNEAARKALSFARTKDGWKLARDLLPEKETSLKPIELADWCREHALFDAEWKVLVSLIAVDGWNRDAIRRIKPRVENRNPETFLRPPFAGRWKAVVDKTGHHQIKVWAIYAIDFVKVDAGGFVHSGSGKALEDYFGFDQPIYAAEDGEVEHVEKDFNDMPPGKSGKFEEANSITIKHSDREYSTYGHMKKGSATVKKGDPVKKGQVIGRIGNSGASGLPHLHFTMMTPVFTSEGKGAWVAIPYRFGGFTLVEANGARCQVEVKSARPQEGWVLECPKPE